ncbi:hypothetical protein N0V83_008546 [Neocucurbitaria cava]|uniref:Uncharacterized protein n=1 Tax=Neocucurbitaria cava TaxID=798079 RepID=A0A9W8Y4U6_9PLEO|nr:hypothetical protein N0V83_008546 [Neocucurbitaria cava]
MICEGCDACHQIATPPKVNETVTAAAAAGEKRSSDATAIVIKRETEIVQTTPPHCVFVCDNTECCYQCPNAATGQMTKDLNNTLVIDEATLNNGTVAITIDNKLDDGTQQAGGQRKCVHWVCVFRNCFRTHCDVSGNGSDDGPGGGDETAYLASMAPVGGAEKVKDPVPAPNGCSKVCNEDAEVCVTVCAPASPEKTVCQQRCTGDTCWTVCTAAAAATDGGVEKAKDDPDIITFRQCRVDCIVMANICYTFCYAPFYDSAAGVVKRTVTQQLGGAGTQKLGSRYCQEKCTESGDGCWTVCYPPFFAIEPAAERRGVEGN